MTRAIIYCRISRDPLHTELGVKRQQKECEALCAQRGLDVVGVEVDDDRSAYSGKRRPGYERALEAITERTATVLVAWHPDRLTRQVRELERLIEVVERANATVLTVQAGTYDLSTPTGRMTARVVGSVAQHESEHKSARLRAKHRELAEAGKVPGGGTRPFGFEDDRVTVRESEAAIIRRIAAEVLAGQSILGVVTRLNDEGVTTSAGRNWYASALRRLLTSARIAGLREHTSGVYKAEWAAIITPDEHRRLVVLLTDPARRTNENKRTYLLTGTLRCGLCNERMTAQPVGGGRPAYTCRSIRVGGTGCGRVKTLAEPLEAFVVEAILAATGAASLVAPKDEPGTSSELELVEAKLSELAEMWAAGELDRTSWSAARRPLEQRRDALAAEMRQTSTDAAAARLVPAGKSLADVWPTLDTVRQRAAVRLLIEGIDLGPAVRGRNFFDSSRVTIRWRA